MVRKVKILDRIDIVRYKNLVDHNSCIIRELSDKIMSKPLKYEKESIFIPNKEAVERIAKAKALIK